MVSVPNGVKKHGHAVTESQQTVCKNRARQTGAGQLLGETGWLGQGVASKMQIHFALPGLFYGMIQK